MVEVKGKWKNHFQMFILFSKVKEKKHPEGDAGDDEGCSIVNTLFDPQCLWSFFDAVTSPPQWKQVQTPQLILLVRVYVDFTGGA